MACSIIMANLICQGWGCGFILSKIKVTLRNDIKRARKRVIAGNRKRAGAGFPIDLYPFANVFDEGSIKKFKSAVNGLSQFRRNTNILCITGPLLYHLLYVVDDLRGVFASDSFTYNK